MKPYTDIELREFLAKMLPEKLEWHDGVLKYRNRREHAMLVLDTELLHLCFLVEESLDNFQRVAYEGTLYNQTTSEHSTIAHFQKTHATWKHRIPALAKVKGIV